MANPKDTLAFKTLATQSSAVLLTHGVEVEATSVRGVADHLVEVMAQQVDVDHEEAVHLVTPEAVAEIIMKAVTEDNRGAVCRPARDATSTDRRPYGQRLCRVAGPPGHGRIAGR